MDLMRNSYFSSSLQLLPRILVTPTAPFIGTMSQNHYIVGLYLQATSVTHKVTAWTVSSLGTLKMFLTDTFLYSYFLVPLHSESLPSFELPTPWSPSAFVCTLLSSTIPSLLPIWPPETLWETENSSSS